MMNSAFRFLLVARSSMGWCGIVLSGALTVIGQEAVNVEKVDPPSWWVQSTLSPVRLLVRGKGLHPGTTIATGSPKLNAYNYRSSENGHYLFADLQIDPDCVPGDYEFQIRSPDGQSAPLAFAVLPRLVYQPLGYSSDDFIYFVMPDRFCDGDPANNAPAKSAITFDRSQPRHYHGGDLVGLTSRLPYLQELGMTAIWTTPIYDNHDGLDHLEAYPNADNVMVPTTGYHGYGAVDMYAVDEHLGSIQELRAFIDTAHAMGMKVIQDQVANHTGPYHAWAADPPTPTWWNGTLEDHKANNWQKWTAMNPRAVSETRSQNLDGWFLDVLPDFNQDDPEVARYLIQNSVWWLGTAQFDAIRMDTLPHVPRSFWALWASTIKKEFPSVVILGELFDSDPVLLSYYQGGRVGHDGIDTQIDSLFDFGLFGPIRGVFAGNKSIREIHQMFARDWLYPNPDALTTFVGVHDMQRFMNESGASIEGLKMALTLIATSRGTPLLYYGDEIAMRGGGDPDNRRDFPGGFPGDDRNAFEASGRTDEENDVWNHVARLGQLRQEFEPLRRGRSLDLLDGDQQYAYCRATEDDSVVVVFNNDSEPAEVRFSVRPLPSKSMREGWNFQCDDRLQVAPPLKVENGIASVILPAKTAAMYRMPE